MPNSGTAPLHRITNLENFKVRKYLPIPCQNTMGTGSAAHRAIQTDWRRNRAFNCNIMIWRRVCELWPQCSGVGEGWGCVSHSLFTCPAESCWLIKNCKVPLDQCFPQQCNLLHFGYCLDQQICWKNRLLQSRTVNVCHGRFGEGFPQEAKSWPLVRSSNQSHANCALTVEEQNLQESSLREVWDNWDEA